MSQEEVLHQGDSDHWKTLPNPEVAKLSIDEKVDIASKRMQDLLTGKVAENQDKLFNRAPVVTTSSRGINRMRAMLRDEHSNEGYCGKDHYIGIVAADDSGCLYAETHYPNLPNNSSYVYEINPEHPERSVVYSYEAGKPPTELDLKGGLDGLIYSLGRMRRVPAGSDYEEGLRSPFEFLHPDLQGVPLAYN